MRVPEYPLSGEEDVLTSTLAPLNLTTVTGQPLPIGNVTVPPMVLAHPFCQWILMEDIDHTRVRVWDCVIFVPNLMFLLYLIYKMPTSIAKLRNTNSPIFLAFHVMVCLVASTSVLRSVVSMTVNAALPAGDITDKLLWLVLRFFLLATEMSVVIFGLMFGHLDSRTSIRRVILVTSTIALAYSVTQGTLEFIHGEDNVFSHTINKNYSLFGHGGMLFWFVTSLLYFLTYTCITLLPLTSLRRRYALPTRRTFYAYCGLLAVLNLGQAVGSFMLYSNEMEGMCVVDVTTYLYFTAFAPLVYVTFLRDFFSRSVSTVSISYSYKPQVDDAAAGEDDVLTLPHHHNSSSSSKNMAASQSLPSPVGGSINYDSTQFASPNPLYFSNSMGSSINAELSITRDYFADDSTG